MPNPVVLFEITGAEGTALQTFYRELFDWKIDTNNEWQYGVVETGGNGGINGGIAGNQDGAAGGRVTVYAAVDDLQAYLDKAERMRGQRDHAGHRHGGLHDRALRRSGRQHYGIGQRRRVRQRLSNYRTVKNEIGARDPRSEDRGSFRSSHVV